MKTTSILAILSLLAGVGVSFASNPVVAKAEKVPILVSTAGITPNAPTASKAGRPIDPVAAGKPTKKAPQIGPASWYGKAFHGRKTANGEEYDMFQLTAAHRSLPLGSWVKVTNLKNGKWVIVRVNDRGPFIGNRIMDVSYGAAQMLEFRERGVQRVKLELVEPGTTATGDDWAIAD